MLNSVEAQRLSIHILTAVGPNSGLWLASEMAKDSGNMEEDVRKFLRTCVSFGSDLRSKPDQFDTVDKVCMSILRRQTNREAVSKDDYGKALGLSGRVQRLRVEKGEAGLSYANITGICSGFQDPVLRRFWENRLFELFPEVSVAGRQGDLEMRSLVWLCAALQRSDNYQNILDKIEESDRGSLEALLSARTEEPPRKFGEEPVRLYSAISALTKTVGLNISDLAGDELGIQPNTWYSWRQNWTLAEGDNFKDGIPKNRLTRVQMMLLSVIFDLDLYESAYFLALAGYRFIPGEPDGEVIRSLRGIPEAMSRDALKTYLREGMFTGRWK